MARIQITDDEPIVALALAEILRTLNHEVTGIASSALEAISLATAVPPDFILMDVHLGGTMDGIEAARRIGTSGEAAIIYVTAYAGDKVIEQAAATRPYAYLVKPVSERELKAALEIALVRRALERELLERERQLRSAVNECNSARVKLETLNGSLVKLNPQLGELAITGSLNGSHNRRGFGFDEKFPSYVRLMRHMGLPLSLLMIDVDRLKGYNDRYGYPAGDSALRAVATLLSAHERTADFLGPYGGEGKFAVILPNTGRPGVLRAAERLRTAVAAHAWQFESVTISVGAATLEDWTAPEGHTVLLAQAEQALYRAKAAGRNCVIHYAGEGDAP